jgi:hypothetical protein
MPKKKEKDFRTDEEKFDSKSRIASKFEMAIHYAKFVDWLYGLNRGGIKNQNNGTTTRSLDQQAARHQINGEKGKMLLTHDNLNGSDVWVLEHYKKYN